VRPEGKEIRQPVFAAEGIGDGEEARRQDADLHEGGDAARLAIGGEVISDAGEARHRHDQRHVGEKDQAGEGAVRKDRPGAQRPASLRPGSQRVAWVRVHSRRLALAGLAKHVDALKRHSAWCKAMRRENRASG
jgi:hypothetical protein